MLLVGAGLLLGSMRQLFAVDPGFDASHVVTVQVQESGQRYRKYSDRLRFFDQALERVRQVPGVVSAGFTSQLPLSGDHDVYGMMFEGENNNDEAFFKYNVTPGYLEAMRIPLIAGRLLNEQDMLPDSPRAVVINESFAKRKLPGRNPIGRLVCLRCGLGKDGSPWSTIVGVVGDVRQLSLELTSEDAVYVPSSRWYWAETTMSLVVRTQGDAASLVPAIRSAIWAVDKDQPIVRVATMQTLVTASQAQRRFAMIILEVFALVALLLAATGLYGVLAGSVTERTREIGVRVALGATPTVILRLVVGQGVWLTLAGIAGGMLGAVAASRALISLLFGISRLDPTPTWRRPRCSSASPSSPSGCRHGARPTSTRRSRCGRSKGPPSQDSTSRKSSILVRALFFWSVSPYVSVIVELSVRRDCVRTVSHARQNPGATR